MESDDDELPMKLRYEGTARGRACSPGADDDASGIAGVLAAARAIKKLSALKRPKRTIRFVLFNAEEVGLVGSGEYARAQKALVPWAFW